MFSVSPLGWLGDHQVKTRFGIVSATPEFGSYSDINLPDIEF
jgi:hypothetical protein